MYSSRFLVFSALYNIDNVLRVLNVLINKENGKFLSAVDKN